MKRESPQDRSSQSLSILAEIDAACDRFEAEWRAGSRPEIQAYLAQASPPARRGLLAELLRVEIAYRRKQGEVPQAGDYQTFASLLDSALLASLLVPSTKAKPGPAVPLSVLNASTGPFEGGPPSEKSTVPGAGKPAAPSPARRRFGDYELIKELGKGGMGVVYLARQRSADRLVALKLIRLDRLEHLSAKQRQEWLDRFRREGQATARINDERVVTVYEVGALEGRPFYSMRFVEGRSLAAILETGTLPNRPAAVLMEKVARAVQAIHDQGILHRDLKPHNILVDTAGRPYVTDLGLAKWLDAAEGFTHTGEVLGSPSYMSPEQAQDSANVTEATDVYGLGATLYVMLTGRPPFEGQTAAEVLYRVKYREPAAPRRLNSAVSRDLETIVLKCLEKEPGRRYRSAGEMADELQRYLEERPILSRPVGPPGRLWRWCRRNRVVSSVSAAAALLLLAASIVVAVKSAESFQAKQSEELAQKGRQQAEEGRQQAVGELKGAKEGKQKAEVAAEEQKILKLQADYPYDMRQAGEAWYAQNYARVHELLKKHDPKPGRDAHRRWEWHYLKAHTPSLEPGGKKAAVPRTLMADAPRRAVPDPQESQAPPLLTWLKDEPHLSILNPDGEFFVWHSDTQARTQFTLHPPTEAVVLEDAVWAPVGQRVASRSPDGTHHIWDAVTGQRLHILRGHTGSKMPLGWLLDEGRLTWNAGGGLLAALSQDHQVTIWNTQTGEKVFTEGAPPRNPDFAQSVGALQRSRPTWSPDGKRLAFWRHTFASQVPPELTLVDGTTGKDVKVPSKTFESLIPPEKGIIGGFMPNPAPLVWRPDGKYLACPVEPPFAFGTGRMPANAKEAILQQAKTKFGGTIVVLDSQTGESVHRAQGISPSWSPDGKYFIFQRAEGDRVVDFETKKEIKHPAGRVLAWSRDGKRMALFTGEVSSQLKFGWIPRPGESQVPNELLLRDGELHIIDVAAGKSDPILKLGNPRKPKPKPKQAGGGGPARMPPGQVIPGAPGGPGGLAVPPVIFPQDSRVSVWVVERWCPDLKWVALEKSETMVRLDPITGQEQLSPRMPSSPPLLGLPPAKKSDKPKRGDKAGLPPGLPPPPGATASVAEVYNLATREKPLRLPALWLTWSPDGQRVVLDNGKVWNVAARKEIANVPGLAYAPALPGGIVSSEKKTFVWSPDGKWLLVGSSSSKVNEATPGWQVYDTSTWKVSGNLPRNALVRFSSDSQRVLAGVRVGEPTTGEFFLFKIPSGEQKKLGASPQAADVVAAAWSPEGKLIATGSGLGIVRVWEAGTGAHRLQFVCPHRVVAVAWSKDGRLFAADAAGVVKAWDIATQKEVVSWKVDVPKDPLPFHTVALKLQFSPHASRLAMEGPESVQVWDAATGKLLSKLGAGGRILAWSPDENALAMREKKADVWIPSPNEFNQPAQQANGYFTRTWNVLTGKEIATFYKPENSVTPVAAAWSPNGRRLAFSTVSDPSRACEPGTVIKIHDTVSAQEVLTLKQEASVLAWSRDGRRLAAQFAVRRIDGTPPRPAVMIWDATPEKEGPGRQKVDAGK